MKHFFLKVGIALTLGITTSLIYSVSSEQALQIDFLREQLEKGTLSNVAKQVAVLELAQKGNVEALSLLLDHGVKLNPEIVQKFKKAVKFKPIPNRAQIFHLLDNAV